MKKLSTKNNIYVLIDSVNITSLHICHNGMYKLKIDFHFMAW